MLTWREKEILKSICLLFQVLLLSSSIQVRFLKFLEHLKLLINQILAVGEWKKGNKKNKKGKFDSHSLS